jgi:hypothetical protein
MIMIYGQLWEMMAYGEIDYPYFIPYAFSVSVSLPYK